MSERPCFFVKPKTWRQKGCSKPARYRVVMGKGFFIDVCEEHVEGYKGLGFKIIKLEELKV